MKFFDGNSDCLGVGTQDQRISSSPATINLPTDEKLAIEGLEALKKVMAALPEEIVGKTANNEDLIAVYCGSCPEVGGCSGSLLTHSDLNLEQAVVLIDAINNNGWARVIRHAHLGFSIVNKEAVERVIKNNRDYFPEEAASNPLSWLSNNSAQWFLGAWTDIKEIRYGLLSGYPLNACLNEVAYNQARKKLINNVLPEETMEEALFLINFEMRGGRTDRSPEELARFCGILKNKYKGLLSEEEISLWLKRHHISDCGGFFGYDKSDDAWGAAADKLLRKIKASFSSAKENR